MRNETCPMKKRLIILLIILSCMLSACETKFDRESSFDTAILNQIAQTLEQEDLENLKLTIYYMPLNIMTRTPLTVDQLINHSKTDVVILRGDEAADAVQLIKEEIRSVTLVPIGNPSEQYARLYYVFEANGEKVFDVSFGGKNENMFFIFNGIEMNYNEWFFNVVAPYIPDTFRTE